MHVVGSKWIQFHFVSLFCCEANQLKAVWKSAMPLNQVERSPGASETKGVLHWKQLAAESATSSQPPQVSHLESAASSQPPQVRRLKLVLCGMSVKRCKPQPCKTDTVCNPGGTYLPGTRWHFHHPYQHALPVSPLQRHNHIHEGFPLVAVG